MQQVLIIGKVWPEPGSSAAGSRTLQLARLFIEHGFEVSLASASGQNEFTANLNMEGIKQIAIELNSISFDELLISLKPDLVVFDRFTTEEQFGWRVTDHYPEALRVLDTIDLHCLRNARQMAVKENRNHSEADLLVSEIAKREVAAIYRCDLTLMVSEVEIEILNHTFGVPKNLLYYLPLFYEPVTREKISSLKSFEERNNVVTIGNFLHEPNWDSVLYLKKVIWPIIRNKMPKAQLLVYGSYATQKVFDLHNPQEGFIIKGRAENASFVMENARLCIAPLRFGAGIKGKLLDAMMSGTPNVTTHIGAEGMHGNLPWSGAIADSAEDFAMAAAELYENKEKWILAQRYGFEIINLFFSKKRHALPFINAIHSVIEMREHNRRKNFTGNLLRQQQYGATKYMALWIEAKNKTKNP